MTNTPEIVGQELELTNQYNEHLRVKVVDAERIGGGASGDIYKAQVEYRGNITSAIGNNVVIKDFGQKGVTFPGTRNKIELDIWTRIPTPSPYFVSLGNHPRYLLMPDFSTNEMGEKIYCVSVSNPAKQSKDHQELRGARVVNIKNFEELVRTAYGYALEASLKETKLPTDLFFFLVRDAGNFESEVKIIAGDLENLAVWKDDEGITKSELTKQNIDTINNVLRRFVTTFVSEQRQGEYRNYLNGHQRLIRSQLKKAQRG